MNDREVLETILLAMSLFKSAAESDNSTIRFVNTKATRDLLQSVVYVLSAQVDSDR